MLLRGDTDGSFDFRHEEEEFAEFAKEITGDFVENMGKKGKLNWRCRVYVRFLESCNS